MATKPIDVYKPHKNYAIQAVATYIDAASHPENGKWRIVLRIVNTTTEKNIDVPFPFPPCGDPDRQLRIAVAYAIAMIDRGDPKLP